MTVECPAGNIAGSVEQSISLFTPTYIIKDKDGEDKFAVEVGMVWSQTSLGIETSCRVLAPSAAVSRLAASAAGAETSSSGLWI